MNESLPKKLASVLVSRVYPANQYLYFTSLTRRGVANT